MRNVGAKNWTNERSSVGVSCKKITNILFIFLLFYFSVWANTLKGFFETRGGEILNILVVENGLRKRLKHPFMIFSHLCLEAIFKIESLTFTDLCIIIINFQSGRSGIWTHGTTVSRQTLIQFCPGCWHNGIVLLSRP